MQRFLLYFDHRSVFLLQAAAAGLMITCLMATGRALTRLCRLVASVLASATVQV
jgi:hypothetical protein